MSNPTWTQVDALSAPVPSSNASASLADVCYKPLGADCATQSILQVILLLHDWCQKGPVCTW